MHRGLISSGRGQDRMEQGKWIIERKSRCQYQDFENLSWPQNLFIHRRINSFIKTNKFLNVSEWSNALLQKFLEHFFSFSFISQVLYAGKNFALKLQKNHHKNGIIKIFAPLKWSNFATLKNFITPQGTQKEKEKFRSKNFTRVSILTSSSSSSTNDVKTTPIVEMSIENPTLKFFTVRLFFQNWAFFVFVWSSFFERLKNRFFPFRSISASGCSFRFFSWKIIGCASPRRGTKRSPNAWSPNV